ncbi:hypothetical protein GCM10020254_35720 [Streptomyces goshikiensis]
MDAYEDGDDEVLVPAAHPDPQEVPAPLAALLDGLGPVRGEPLLHGRGFVAVPQPAGGQEHALVYGQLAHPVQYGGLGFGRAVRRGHPQPLEQRHHALHHVGVGERSRLPPGFEVLARAQFHGQLPGLVGVAGAAERVVDVVHDHRRVLLGADAPADPGEPYAGVRLGGVGGRVGVPARAEVARDGPRDVPALESDDGDHGGEDGRHPHQGEAREGGAEGLAEQQGAEGERGAEGVVVEQGQQRPGDREQDDEEGPPAVDPYQEGEEAERRAAPVAQPVREAQQQEREEEHREGAAGEQGAGEPGAEYGGRPAEFGAAGAQGVGEDPCGVEAVGGRDDPLLVDVQLLDHPIAVRGVEVGARAQQPARLADRRVHRGAAVAGIVPAGGGLRGESGSRSPPDLRFRLHPATGVNTPKRPGREGRGAGRSSAY